MTDPSESRAAARDRDEVRHLWLPPVLIVLAALVAHGLCLGSTFYLDDWTQVVDNAGVVDGRWQAYQLRALTYLTYCLTYRCCGMSSVAFHAGNLLLHAGIALGVYSFTREFLHEAAALPVDRARRVGAWAGTLFAVHPLCSEIPNYTRARDIALVSLFTLLTARAILRWRRRGGWPWLLAAVGAIVAATFSKEVGLIVAGGAAALVGFGVSRREPTNRTGPRSGGATAWPKPLLFALGGSLIGFGLLAWARSIFWQLYPLALTAAHSLRNPRMGWHLLTQARVFWMYAWRVFAPIHLCSDHQIAWTVSMSDGIAWLSAGSLGAVLAMTVALWFRVQTRPLALLLTLAWLAILHRLGNVSGELMVEYRMYPAMMFLCSALAWGIDRLSPRPSLPALLVLICTALSIGRTRDWRTSEILAANVVTQYPLQARARQEAQEADIREGRWPSVLARQAEIRRALDGIEAFRRSQSLRRYNPDLATLTRVSSEGNYALGLVHTGQRRAAFAHFGWLMQAMRDNHLTEPFYWANFYYSRGLYYEFIGQDDDAALDLRDSRDLAPYMNFAQRELQRLEARRKK